MMCANSRSRQSAFYCWWALIKMSAFATGRGRWAAILLASGGEEGREYRGILATVMVVPW